MGYWVGNTASSPTPASPLHSYEIGERGYAHVDVASASGLKSASMAWQLMIANNSLLRRISYVE